MDLLAADSMFFIRDLLQAKHTGEYFIWNNVKFNSVCVCGTITDALGDEEEENLSYIVDDTTDCIRCFAGAEYEEPELKGPKGEIANGDSLEQIAKIIACCTKRLTERTSVLDAQPGDIVRIFGKLKRGPERNYIFIDAMEKIENLGVKTAHLETLLFLYNNIYPKQVVPGDSQ